MNIPHARIGLLSDSHGNARITAQAVQLLVANGAQRLIHLGDINSQQVIDALLVQQPDGSLTPIHVVFGNTDLDELELGRYAAELGVIVDHPVGRLRLPDQRELIFMHGHDTSAMMAALKQGAKRTTHKPTYLCHGHTHQAADDRQGAVRVINPGALHRARQYTVALLDTQRDSLTFYRVAKAC